MLTNISNKSFDWVRITTRRVSTESAEIVMIGQRQTKLNADSGLIGKV
jgi:hypothetical protein